jgi:signal transduction histidine kinase
VNGDAIAVAGSDDTTVGEDFSNRQEIEDVLSTGNPTTGQRFSRTLGEDLFFVAVPVLSGDDVVGAVRLSAPEEVVTDRANSRVRGLLGVALISLAIAVFVAWLVARSVTRPLRRLEAATAELAQGNLRTRASTEDGPSEIRSLAASFNSMASRLQQLVARQRDFAGTASHQLRTPLTALRLRLEQLAIEGDTDAETVQAALDETDRLHRMIEGLLMLSRAEDAAVGPEQIDLAVIAAGRAEHWRPLAEERGVRLAVSVPETAPAMAVPGAAEQIVDNLVDNALEVSPSGSTLTIEVRRGRHLAELHVIDEGPGLPPEHRAAAFDRFWRGEDASPGGSGLGLAIVHQLAAAGDGAAELRAAPSGGVDAVVMFATP